MKPTEELQTLHLSTSFRHRNDFHMKGGDPYNKKHTKYEGTGTRPRGSLNNEMARLLKRDIRISSEMATDAKRFSFMVKTSRMVTYARALLRLERTMNLFGGRGGRGRGGEGRGGEGRERSRQSDRQHYVISRHRTSSGSF